jgi:pimeloyl-[acyl-carrier protein] methyl ester esterase
MKIIVLNGWAASEHAWDLCKFSKYKDVRIFSYLELLDGIASKYIEKLSEPFILIGWSMGGTWALGLSALHHSKIAGLVLVAATPRMMEDKEAGWKGMSARRLEAFLRGAEMLNGEPLFGVPEGKPNPYMADSITNLQRGIVFLRDTDLRQQLEIKKEELNFPVHIFQSERDGIVKADNTEWLKKIFPHANITIVPGNEHALSIMIPGEIDEAVDSCIAITTQSKNS